jgi:hypothetical protein
MNHEVLRIAALIVFAASVWVPTLRWGRMSEPQRYLAVAVLGAAFVFYLSHPTLTACDQDATQCGPGY